MMVLLVLVSSSGQAGAFDPETTPIFDAHIHYSMDVWDAIPAADAIRRLEAVGIKRAMVSSTSDEGTLRLFRSSPGLVLPVLRPYRKFGTTRSWMHDETVIPYLEKRLSKYRYVAIGEFHLQGEEADLPVVRAVVQLAKKYGLMLHVHSDADAIELIISQDPDAKIVWAHAGFEEGHVVSDLLDNHDKLWADLSFRREIFVNGRFLHGWRELLIRHSDRFMLAIDTYIPQRWLKLNEVMGWQRSLLKHLPVEVAKRIAWENGENVVTRHFKGIR